MHYVYGPVASRRLGRSLGIDIVPAKTCSFNCIYCQLGSSRPQTIERAEYVPLNNVESELRDTIDCAPDYITISGSGEPTLYSRLGELLDRIRAWTNVPIAVLTNGSLLWRTDVREELSGASLVMPSLDAGNEAMFAAVNRPHEDLTFDLMLQGLIDFRKAFQGQIWLEILLVSGFTAYPREIDDLRKCVARIRPDRVQLNTVTRPPAEHFALPVSLDDLQNYAALFSPVAEVIGEASGNHTASRHGIVTDDILKLIQRRPCTLQDVADGLGIHVLEAAKHLEVLTAEAHIDSAAVGSKVFYLRR